MLVFSFLAGAQGIEPVCRLPEGQNTRFFLFFCGAFIGRWPQAHADELEVKGFPAKKILNSYLAAAEKQGYVWPVRYVIK